LDALHAWQVDNSLHALHAAFLTASLDTKTAFCKQLLVFNLRLPLYLRMSATHIVLLCECMLTVTQLCSGAPF